MTTSGRRRVAVIGGGLAGITAALRCADAGADVTLYESRPRLGGLTYSFRRAGLWIDNGQHVFLRCCTAYQQLLCRLGVADLVCLQPRLDIAVHGPTRTARLRRSDLPSPLHLSGSIVRYPWLSPARRASFVRAALALRAVDATDPRSDRPSFGNWLREHGQDRRSIDVLWDLVGVAALNARAEDASLALAAMVFQRGLLGDNAAGDIGWSRVPLQQLHGDAAAAVLAQAGARVQLRAKVAQIRPLAGGIAVTADGDALEVDDVVLAVAATAAERLLPDGALDQPAGWSRVLGSAPIINLHFVLDRRVLDEPFVAGVDNEVQWVFDRTGQSGLTRGQYLAVSCSAADELVDVATADLRARFEPQLAAIVPRLRTAQILDFFVTRERSATFRPAPGTAALRPPATTGVAGVYVAGAWTATGWPDTMEGAVRSGDSAAVALLADRGRPADQEQVA